MNRSTASTDPEGGFRLRFESLFNAGHAYEFPCDRQGQVALETLGEVALNNYLYARTVVGREFLMPTLRVSAIS